MDGRCRGRQKMKIVELHPLLVPTSMGGFLVHLYGLGDDNKVYMWTAKDGKWEQVKAK